jgi:hypothetical protein
MFMRVVREGDSDDGEVRRARAWLEAAGMVPTVEPSAGPPR